MLRVTVIKLFILQITDESCIFNCPYLLV